LYRSGLTEKNFIKIKRNLGYNTIVGGTMGPNADPSMVVFLKTE
jgi:hypothetical protein